MVDVPTWLFRSTIEVSPIPPPNLCSTGSAPRWIPRSTGSAPQPDFDRERYERPRWAKAKDYRGKNAEQEIWKFDASLVAQICDVLEDKSAVPIEGRVELTQVATP